MGERRRPDRVKLIVGLISNQLPLFEKAKKALEKKFGKIDFESPLIDFRHTDYYKEEMGENLKRAFVSFDDLIPLKNAHMIKLRTNRLEKLFSKSGRRAVNIDPGYLDLSRLVLFSTKDYSHRIHLKGGIFAEATLFYKDKTFNPWPWTYPDYKSKTYIDIFNSIRRIYKAGLDHLRGGPPRPLTKRTV